MAAGWQAGATCYPTAELAAASSCANAYGVTSSGLLSCSAYTVVTGNAELTLSDSSIVTVFLAPCDRITYADTWAPIFGALLVATVVIWGLKKLLTPFKTYGDE